MVDLASTIDTELPEEKLFRRLCSILSTYLEPNQIEATQKAFEFGAEAHSGQFRISGEAYICHPLSVAIILADMRMDTNGVMAAILHDVIEDTAVTKEQILDRFTEEVAELVDGVSKLTQLACWSRAEAQAENMRKMFLAMARDLRVIMVKLADRVHNMRTLGVMPAEKRKRIARETLDIYAPIANRLGMNKIRLELEEHGFSAMHPMRYRTLDNEVRKARGHRKEVVATIESAIKKRLFESGLNCDVLGREKHVYSIYKKMLVKGIKFSDVFDVYGFRIISQQADDCYRVLGAIHSLYKPVPGRFKDYIALPKANGYQSLHTVLIGPFGLPLEIQVRTQDMDLRAESGIAAHWLYKGDDEHASNTQDRANEWLRDLLEIQKNAGDSLEFIDNLKVDLFSEEVYVFTPKGKIVKLRKGATIIDFAYAVHTDIGNSCISARSNRRLVSLQTKLENGQTIEVVTAQWARPNPLWLNYVVTAKARSAIRAYLRNLKRKEAIVFGRRLLDKELNVQGMKLADIPKENLFGLQKALEYSDFDDLLVDIGLGNRMPFLTAKHLCEQDLNLGINLNASDRKSFSPLIIKGTEGMVVGLAKCCHPIPGDPIIGFFNPGKGIVIHLNDCKNVSDIRKKNPNWLDVEWDPGVSGDFSAEIRLEVRNKKGTLATIAATISALGSNIENISIRDQDIETSVDLITFAVKDRIHLAKIMRKLRNLSIVLKLSRVTA